MNVESEKADDQALREQEGAPSRPRMERPAPTSGRGYSQASPYQRAVAGPEGQIEKEEGRLPQGNGGDRRAASSSVDEAGGGSMNGGRLDRSASSASLAPPASFAEMEQEDPTREDILQQARQEIDGLKNNWARERAEFINFRKRVAQDRERQRSELTASFVAALLPVLDNLSQALHADPKSEEVKKYMAGVDMIRQNFISVLGGLGVREIRPQDEPFDPQSMEAIMSEASADLAVETVLEVFQSGYAVQLGDASPQIIRAAKVKVGKPLAGKVEDRMEDRNGGERASRE